ncbi:MAG: hypothetical protein PWP51_1293 [Clostridiales bacterium]|jgi:thymidine kinase|uniref:Twitching motility protein PilT n=1 Tax=Fusibacter paucivorans TaxID=76009 RepID=A0ABS5PK22_9FIRM|nr:hypothetical protein [Fusibacter paucivorans]MBS7525488.1 hypothetical protein [Fusibacter paucivorans]MDK2866470.1 hypothetical protein [Clostridiales bacterium]MDN5298740.1 hypothetical protein [Clostridiales bacterium]
MVKLIAGKKGSGKSKEIVRLANECVKSSKGTSIFIDDDKRAMYDLHHSVRFINLEEFPIDKGDELLGFICGLISNNYDIENIFIDGILNCIEIDMDQLSQWFAKLDDLSTAYDINFTITLSHDGALPERLHKFIA